jgi:hypothetical protein
MWTVVYLPEAERELVDDVPQRERAALHNAVVKLQNIGPSLGYPHSSNVEGSDRLRELRPRSGRSPWRALYRQFGETFAIGAVCLEAQQNPRRLNEDAKTLKRDCQR